jgi:hypothetical protein
VVFTYDTISPTSTPHITPTGGITVTAVGVNLEWDPVGPEGGSPVAYVVELDGQAYTTTQSSYVVSPIDEGPHSWRVQVFDAAGNRSDWAAGAFSVSQHHYLFPLAMNGFEEGQPPCADVVVNGGFESDEGWTLNQLATYDTDQVHSDARSVRVGVPPGEPGFDKYSSVMQAVTMPASSRATLRLWVYPFGEEGDLGDYHYVGLRDQSGVYHALDHWQSDARTWEPRQYDLSAYSGQTVTLYIGTRNDEDDDTAAMYVDDVALEVCP